MLVVPDLDSSWKACVLLLTGTAHRIENLKLSHIDMFEHFKGMCEAARVIAIPSVMTIMVVSCLGCCVQ